MKVKFMNFKNKIISIRNSKLFSLITTIIIIVYSSLLGLRTIVHFENYALLFFYILDYIITIYFFTEIVIKLYPEKRTLDFFKNGWNVFDFIVVLITLIPLENSTIATVARLFRVFRILRLITSRPELKNIIDMLIGAIPSIIDIAILLFIIFYIYAIIGNALFVSAPSGLWKDFLVA